MSKGAVAALIDAVRTVANKADGCSKQPCCPEGVEEGRVWCPDLGHFAGMSDVGAKLNVIVTFCKNC